MKKIITLIIWLFIIITLSSCGQTEEEKNQEKAIKWWLGILYEMWKQAQDWASDQDVMNNGLDKLANLAWTLTDWTDQELTEKEKDALKKWADMLKDWGKWLQSEIMKTIEKEQEKIKNWYREKFGDAEQLEWAEKEWILTPKWLDFYYMMANKKDWYFYKSFYKWDTDDLISEWKRIIKKLWLKIRYEVTKEQANQYEIEQISWYWEKDWYKYNIAANSNELIFQVTRPIN